MRKPRVIIAAGVLAIVALPLGALANHSGSCSYVTNQEHKAGQNGVFVYADTNQGGTTGSADQAAGVCVNQNNVGGTFEAGHTSQHGTNYNVMPGLKEGGYVVLDGASGNPDPGDGYIGVSNFEKRESNCTPGSGGNPPYCSTNSGGQVGLGGGPYAPVPAPIICGNSTGGNWDDTNRDGCEVP